MYLAAYTARSTSILSHTHPYPQSPVIGDCKIFVTLSFSSFSALQKCTTSVSGDNGRPLVRNSPPLPPEVITCLVELLARISPGF